MKTYSVLYAEDVPHYATFEIEADDDGEALERSKSHDYGDAALEAEWNNPVCKRIVHIEDPEGKIVGNDIALDNTFLRDGGEPDRKLCEAAASLLQALKLARNPHWVHNAGITVDIDALRKICIYYSDWWNTQAWPLIRDLSQQLEPQGVAA